LKRALVLCVLLSLIACHAGPPALPTSGNGGGFTQALSTKPPIATKPLFRTMPFGVIGSSNTITADMPVPHPDIKPCVVKLFDQFAFKNFNNQTFAYVPSTQCKGPWAEVVFNLNVHVSRGIQYDRTGIIWLGGAVLYFGTTAEPSPTLAPHWHVQRDVTNLTALFKNASQGQIELGNLVNSTYTGVIHATAYVQFYPADKKYPAPRVPDEVIGIPYNPPLGNATQLPQSPMEIQTTSPRNIVGADLELYLQSQDQEEQWFMCVPTDVWNKSGEFIGSCPNTAFREGEVSVDGIPAGIAADLSLDLHGRSGSIFVVPDSRRSDA
jgi:hypothetical protein